MFTKNIFNTKKDPIAEAIANIAEADYKAKMEELKGQQHKLDKNKNNKLDSDDFKIIRGEKKVNEEQTDEAVSPFDWKNRPSELKKKPGELTGHDSKKTTTGTVYTKKAPKPEPETTKEEVEAIDERELTPDEVLSREKNVKGMKKSLAGFKARYGDRAKSVMYATATKMAKKD